MISTMKHPSAWIPVAMSLIAFAVVMVHGFMFGFVREADEETAAHIWQILMALQIPIVIFFAVKWLPSTQKQALQVLALQAGAYLLSLAAVFYLESRS